jgi:hypothetical protein
MFDPLHDPDDLLRAIAVSPPITVQVDLDRSTVIPGDPGLYEGLAIASWSRPAGRDE